MTRFLATAGIVLGAVVGALVVIGAALSGALPAVGVVVLFSLPFLVMLWRRPVLRRLATRNASRRPRETALVILGSLLGTAIITGSFVVGDTLRSSIRATAYTQLGPVDELVRATSPEQQASVATKIRGVHSAGITGVLPVTAVVASVSTTDDHPRAEPSANVWELDFDAGRRFGTDPAATGLQDAGPTPKAGEAVVGADLARTLGAKEGSTVRVYAYGTHIDFRVARIVPRLGLAGLNLGFGSESPNLFIAPGTVEAVRAALLRAHAPAPTTAPGPAAPAAPATRGAKPTPAKPTPAKPTPAKPTPSQSPTPTTTAAPKPVPSGAAALAQAAPPRFWVLIANAGGVIQTKAQSDAVRVPVEAALGPGFTVTPVKADTLTAADRVGQSFTQLFSTVGFFSVLAGLLLLINIFVMLAQERKSEMGMLRAMGLRRSGLLGSFSMEGWLYALTSATIGTVAGIGVGRLVVVVASGIFSNGRNKLSLTFAATLNSIQVGFTTGFVISLATVVASSVAISRFNVIRAIRDLPEPENTGRRLGRRILGGVLAVGGLLMSVAGLAAESGLPALVGPAILAIGLVMLLRGLVPARALVSVSATGVLVWAITVFALLRKAFNGGGVTVFIIQGIVLTGAAVALVTQNQDVIGAVIRRLGGGSRNTSLRLGLAYPLARRMRTALILVSYSLVMFTLTFITVFSSLVSRSVDTSTSKVSGGFGLIVNSNASSPIPPAAVAARPGVRSVSPFPTTGAEFSDASVAADQVGWPVATYDASFVSTGPPALGKRDPAYADDLAAYRAVLTDPTVTIVPGFFLRQGGGPNGKDVVIGDQVTMRDATSGVTKTVRIIAMQQDRAPVVSALIAPSLMSSVFGERAVPTQLLVATQPGVDAQALADRINGDYVANGADAASFKKLVHDELNQMLQFIRLLQGYLALGLVVGVAGLGVVMVRAVRERRRQIGVLRALGFPAVAIRRAFVAESSFVASEGILMGAALALVTAWRVVSSASFGEGLPFSIPWVPLLVLIGGTLLASLLATAAPAQQASMIKPAVALRITD